MMGTKKKVGGALLLAGTLAIVLGVTASPSAAASVTPTFVPGTANKTCAELDNDGATVEVKVDPNADGTYNGPNGIQVTISNSQNDKTFDWSSNTPVSSVFVKAGAGGSNLYDYDPSSLGDTNLQSPGDNGNGISHISFCFGGNTTTSSSTSSTSSTTSTSTTSTTVIVTTSAPSTTVGETTTTTAGEGVLPTQQEQTTTTAAPVRVAGVQQERVAALPRTGVDSTAILLVVGLALVAGGTCVLRSATASAR